MKYKKVYKIKDSVKNLLIDLLGIIVGIMGVLLLILLNGVIF